jgi:hypothetical protein
MAVPELLVISSIVNIIHISLNEDSILVAGMSRKSYTNNNYRKIGFC